MHLYTLKETSNLISCSHLCHCLKMSDDITSSQLHLHLQSSCCIIFADKVTGDSKPKGSYTELVVDNIPRLVRGCCFTSILNLKTSDSMGSLSLSKSSSYMSFVRCLSAIVCHTGQLLLIHFSRMNPPLLQKAQGSFVYMASSSEPKLTKQSST